MISSLMGVKSYKRNSSIRVKIMKKSEEKKIESEVKSVKEVEKQGRERGGVLPYAKLKNLWRCSCFYKPTFLLQTHCSKCLVLQIL